MRAEFVVKGEPVGKARPRVTRFGHAYTPETTVLYENLIKMEYERQCGDVYFQRGTPICLRVTAFHGIPKSASKKKQAEMLGGKIRPMSKGDLDNVVKTVGDALNGVAYDDDVQVVQIYAERFYSDNPRIQVGVQSVPDEEQE